MDKNELKIEALRQRIAELTMAYEDRIADLRVELTFTTQENERLNGLVPQDSDADESANSEG